MKDSNCNIIRDLLPLYEDNTVSEDTAELVRDHLKDCPACRKELQRMRTPVSVPPVTDAELLKQFLDGIKKARRKRILIALCVIAALAALAAAFCLWYTRPVSFADLSAEADVTSCQRLVVTASRQITSSDSEQYNLTLTPEDPAFDQLLSLFEAQTYRCTLGNLLSQGNHTWSDPLNPGDFRWNITLETFDSAGKSGDQAVVLEFYNFYGQLEIGVSDHIWQVTVPDQDQWLSEIMELIRQFPAEG